MVFRIRGEGIVEGLQVGGLPDGTVDVDTLAADSVTTPKVNYSGAIVQVVQVVKSNVFSTTSSTFNPAIVDNLSGVITPSSANNAILVNFNINQVGGNTDSEAVIAWRCNGTGIFEHTDYSASHTSGTFGLGMNWTDGTWQGETASAWFVHQPQATTPQNYYCALGGNGSATVYLNRSGRGNFNDARVASSLILMEIQQ
jgi:hypothetical protein